MRAVARPRHLLAVLILTLAAAAHGYLGFHDRRLSTAQVQAATASLKDHDPTLFPGDAAFGPSGLWRLNSPAFRLLLGAVSAVTGRAEPLQQFRLLVAPVVLLYLCEMYALLYGQCRSWSVSVFVATLSSAVIWVLAGAYWGVGSLQSITPAGLLVALTPLLMMAYLRWETRPRVMLAFFFVGLAGNVYPTGAVNLAIVLLLACLGRGWFAWRQWLIAAGCAVCVLAGMLPWIWHCVGLCLTVANGLALADPETIRQALLLGDVEIFWDDLLRSLLNWLLLVLVLLVPAVVVLIRIERFRIRNPGFWIWLMSASLFVSVVLHGLALLVGALSGRPPVTIDLPKASCLAMPALYVLFAQALTGFFRLVRGHRGVVRWVCAVLFVAWMLVSDNCRVVRHAALGAATSYMPEGEKPHNVQRHIERRRALDELAAIAAWARVNTDAAAVFLSNSIEFRMMSRRSIVAAGEDVRYFYDLAPGRLGVWCRLMIRQAALLRTRKIDAEALAALLDELAESERFTDARGWYVILPAGATLDKTGVFEQVSTSEWGLSYQLCRRR